MNTRNLFLRSSAALLTLSLSSSCDSENDAGTGSLAVLVESEDVILNGVLAGDSPENIRDGWSVQFDKYIATIGAISLEYATNHDEAAQVAGTFAVDLKKVPGTGLALWNATGLKAGRWEFFYNTANAALGATRHETVEVADYDSLVQNGWTYLIAGSLSHPAGQSCPPAALANAAGKVSNGKFSGTDPCYDAPIVRFEFGAAATTSYGPCEIDGLSGIAITADAVTTVTTTLHGDHLFFNGFPEGDEGGVLRLAQWLADCDLNLDGTVSAQELAAIAPSQLPQIDNRYQLGGSPIAPLNNMYDYVRAQLKTQGHMNGEGACPVDGALAHDHDHDH